MKAEGRQLHVHVKTQGYGGFAYGSYIVTLKAVVYRDTGYAINKKKLISINCVVSG